MQYVALLICIISGLLTAALVLIVGDVGLGVMIALVLCLPAAPLIATALQRAAPPAGKRLRRDNLRR